MKTFLLFALSCLASAQTIAINCGGSAVGSFAADEFFSANTTAYTNSAMGPNELSTLRFGLNFTYSIPLANGFYTATMEFVEPDKTAAGQRLFTVSVNGLSTQQLDIFKLTGGENLPYSLTVPAIVTNGQLTLQFVGIAGQNAIVNSITVQPFAPAQQTQAIPAFVDQEVPAGTIDGTNAVFTLANTPSPAASLQLFRNGVLQKAGTDYALSGAVITFQTGSIPMPGSGGNPADLLLASYRIAGAQSPNTSTIARAGATFVHPLQVRNSQQVRVWQGDMMPPTTHVLSTQIADGAYVNADGEVCVYSWLGVFGIDEPVPQWSGIQRNSIDNSCLPEAVVNQLRASSALWAAWLASVGQ